MSETLYRKYRPKDFDEVIGQESIVGTLKNALKNDTIAHAYIFAGSRGTGKTTIARIFARALGVSQNDLYEMDAASNRGIDEIRAIRDAVSTLPFDSKYKLYILDEAHMLTKDAWNALLKTLEEPPSHVIFIMATTEVDKIPDTILSRSESHIFKKPSQSVLAETVKRTAKKEGFSMEDEAAEILALIADGSFRDAHGALQKIISSISGTKITLKDVETISGAPKISLVNDLIDAIADKSAVSAIEVIKNIQDNNIDIRAFMKLLLERVRLIILIRLGVKKDGEVNVSKDYSAINSEVLLALLDAYERASRSSFPYISLEAALLDLIA